MTPIFGRKKEPREVFDENMEKAKRLYESPKPWKSKYKKLLKHIEKAQEITEKVEVDQEDLFWLARAREPLLLAYLPYPL